MSKEKKRIIPSIFILTLVLLLLLQGNGTANAQVDLPAPEYLSIEGTIVSLPEGGSLIGEWQIRVEDDELSDDDERGGGAEGGGGPSDEESGDETIVTVLVTESTGRAGSEPEIDMEVSVHGFRNAEGQIDAFIIDLIQRPNFEFEHPEIDQDWFHMVGIVEGKPDSEDGYGAWEIRDQREQLVTVLVSRDTELEDELPNIGERVFVKGFSRPDGALSADEVELWANDQPGNSGEGSWDLSEVSGIVDSISNSSESGDDSEVWQIRTTNGIASVYVDEETFFHPQEAGVGQRVNVWGVTEEDERYRALEIAIDSFVASEIVVRLETGVISETIASRYGLVAGSARLSSGGIYQFESLNPRANAVLSTLTEMQADEDIIWAELNYVSELPVEGRPFGTWAWGGVDDSAYTSQSAYAQINLDAAHTKAKGDTVVVAVLDTGIDINHPALAGHIISGWDMVDDDGVPQEEGSGIALGHGTHVSGIVAKVAPNSMIMPIRVLDSNGRGDSFILAYAIDWATDQGADVINLSLGMTEYSQVLHQAVREAVARGVVIVGAAGNGGTDVPNYPAAFTNVIGVTAVDENNQLASFANYGSSVTLAAPGVGIRSTILDVNGPAYATWSGTSMAAPFASGTAALVRQLNNDATSRGVTKVLLDSGSIIGTNSGATGSALAWPMLNAGAAVGASSVAEPVPINPGGNPDDDNGNPTLSFGIFLPFVHP